MEYIDPRRKLESDAAAAIKVRLAALFELFENDPAITEINVNGPTQVFYTRQGKRYLADGLQLREEMLAAALRAVAAAMGQDCQPETASAVVNGKLPGYRFSGVMYPMAACGTSLSIRKHSPRVLHMNDYVASSTIDRATADTLISMVQEGKNLLIAGSTDSGKTTFLNMLCREIPVDVRVGTIEDTREVTLLTPNWFPLEYNKQKGYGATLCVETMMRSSPDRIILGEMKDEVAAAFLEACNTGHEGCMATVHANSGRKALQRMEILVLRAGLGWPIEAIRQTIAMTINGVVHLKKASTGQRVVTEVVEILDYDHAAGDYVFNTLFERADD
jgi:pilus assembly protein CpaF